MRDEEESSRRAEADGGNAAARAMTHAPQDVRGGRIGSAYGGGYRSGLTVLAGGATVPGRERTSGVQA